VDLDPNLDLDRELTRRTVAVGAAAVVGVLLLLAGAVAVAYDAPRVAGTDSAFGEVTAETAAVETTLTVDNPNDVAVPVGVDLRYTVALNDVPVARGAERGVQVGPGNTTVETTAAFDNARIPAWWVTHVDGGERSTLTTRAEVSAGGLPAGATFTVERREIETDLLGPLAENEASRLSLGEADVLVVGNRTGRWGTADADRTPLVVETDLENVHDRPVEFDGAEYEIRMNDVVVGTGTTTDGVRLAPGEATTYEIRTIIDTPRMQRWWVSHLRNGETTNLSVEVYGIVETDGERKRLPLALYEQRAVLTTDFLETGAATVEPVPTDRPAPTFAAPTVESTDSEWGRVGEESTAIRTTATVDNPSDEAYADLLSVVVERRTTVAGVVAAEGTDRVEDLPRGTGDVTVATRMPHAAVPEWWAAHLAAGERSERRTTLDGTADVGATTLPVAVADRNATVETATLSDLDDDSRRAVRSDGRRLLTVHSTTGEYVDPTPEEATIVVTADVENGNPVSEVTLRELDYTVELGDATLADRRAPESYTLGPGERRTVEFTLTLNNSRTAAWWPGHVRRGERSTLRRTATATVETDGETERVELEFLSTNRTVETDLLGDGQG
jgi:LEA14-like dessication related protein